MGDQANACFWDDSFRREVEETAVDDGVLLWYLGGACMALRTPGGLIYLDAYLGPEPPDPPPGFHRAVPVPIDPSRIALADAVLISHDHYDHCHEATLRPLERNTGAVFAGPASVARAMRGWGIAEGRIREVAAGDELEVADARVRVWPACDEGEPQAVTYTLAAGGVTVFFGGDSSAGPAFEDIGAAGVDVAVLAFGRTWYMDEASVLEAAARLRAKLLVPCHWELWRGYTGDPLLLGRLLERRGPGLDACLLQLGQSLRYRSDGRYERGH